MAFNTLPFLVFILLFFGFWPLVRNRRNAKYLFLVLSSLTFYGWWDWRFIFLILFSGIIDFIAGLAMKKYPGRSGLFLNFSVIVNLLSLGIFKYGGFVADQISQVLTWFSIDINLKASLPEFTLILPVGISFYTFQSMSYTIDVYKRRLEPTKNILLFFSYLVLFPQLVAGPIIRARDFINQLAVQRRVSSLQFWNGIKLIITGYFQKAVLADNLAILVNYSFAETPIINGGHWWIVMISFALQIYFDFHGYSQIARGLAKLMGFHFKMNFNHPYRAQSFRDFWNRWHISLSTWFRDYVYIPLGGSKKGKLRAHINMWVTMVLSGLWHGASTNFILWGGYHAFLLSCERLIGGRLPIVQKNQFVFIRWILTISLVLIGWIFFRASSVGQALDIIRAMLNMKIESSFFQEFRNPLIFLVVGALYILGDGYKGLQIRLRSTKFNLIEPIQYATMIAAIIFFRGPEQEFIYFQF